VVALLVQKYIELSFFPDQTAKNVMYVGGVHVIVNVMKRFQHDDLVHENACRALGGFAVHGM
jgi:hypothetical protein